VLTDPEAEVPARLVGAEVAAVLDVGEVALRQVGRAAEQLRDRPGKGLDRLLADLAGRESSPTAGLQAVAPARCSAGPATTELGGLVRERGLVARCIRPPTRRQDRGRGRRAYR
jgi:hypothetical protein